MREEEPEYDPMGPSYPESAIQYWQYRVGLVCLAALFIVIGKSNLVTIVISSQLIKYPVCKIKS